MAFLRRSISRAINIRIEVDRWEFSFAGPNMVETVDITRSVRAYTFQKSIKTPMGGAQIVMDPQAEGVHFMDLFGVHDVVRIYEFDTLKFIGYVRDMNFSATIDSKTGRPMRQVTMIATMFGGLIAESRAGSDLHFIRDKQGVFFDAIDNLNNNWKEAYGDTDAISLDTVVNVFARTWFQFISAIIGGNDYYTYLAPYVAFSGGGLSGAGLSSTQLLGINREFQLYKGGENNFSLWQMLERVAELPFNELWFDNGPRSVTLDSGTSELSDERIYLVARPTPFDGRVSPVVSGPSPTPIPSGIRSVQETSTNFQSVDTVIIPLDHLRRIDFNKSSEEVYTAYILSSASMDLNREAVIAFGESIFDKVNFLKYLYRPLYKRLFYVADPAKHELTTEEGYDEFTSSAARTLRNWYKNNDRFLSGSILMHVPTENALDPKIGQRIQIEDIDGDFYCESITHSWKYKKPLVTSVGVTRGFNKGSEITLLDRIFNPPIYGGIGERRVR